MVGAFADCGEFFNAALPLRASAGMLTLPDRLARVIDSKIFVSPGACNCTSISKRRPHLVSVTVTVHHFSNSYCIVSIAPSHNTNTAPDATLSIESFGLTSSTFVAILL
jgi:hypothetical protein